MTEEWRPVVGLEELYEVSNLGRVRNCCGYIMKLRENRGGYLQVNLSDDYSRSYPVVHRLVARAFIPNPKKSPQVNHIDGDRKNNRVDNLEWCTHGENMRRAFKLGNKNQKGSKNNGSKLTEEIVIEIREKTKSMTQSAIAKEYGLSTGNVSLIVNRKTWTHI